MFKGMKLTKRILLGYAVPAVVYVGFGITVYTTVNQAINTYAEVKRVQKVIVLSNGMEGEVNKLIRSNRGYIIDKNPEFKQEYTQSYELFKQQSKELRELIKRQDQKEKLDKMIEMVNQYYEFSNQIIDAVDQNKQPQAIAIFKTGKGTKLVEEFSPLNDNFNQTEKDFLNKQTTETENSLKYLTIIAMGSLLLLGITIIIAFTITQGITQTMNEATSAIAISTKEIRSSVETQEKIANSQASSVNETTTTMDELNASSRVTAEQAETGAKSAKKALNLAESGLETVEKTLSQMTNLKEKVGAIAQAIVLLNEQTMQISNISALVGDLANQTNMLALNAAVEAVRAGEQGKGFAVVASEIRKLADQSKKSAEKINTLIMDIQKSINSTVMVTETGSQTVAEGVYIAQETAKTFKGVSDAIEQIAVNNQQIALNAQQQALGIEQVVDAMNNINVGSRETANGLSQTKLGLEKLDQAAISLKEVV